VHRSLRREFAVRTIIVSLLVSFAGVTVLALVIPHVPVLAEHCQLPCNREVLFLGLGATLGASIPCRCATSPSMSRASSLLGRPRLQPLGGIFRNNRAATAGSNYTRRHLSLWAMAAEVFDLKSKISSFVKTPSIGEKSSEALSQLPNAGDKKN
jgi:hypothetical protein